MIRRARMSEYVCPCGRPDDDIYEYRLIDGHKTLVKTDDKTDCYEIIQSYKLSTDINNILARTTDIAGLALKVSECMDTTNLPQTMQDFYNIKLRLTDAWRSLTAVQKAAFGNDVDLYISTLGGTMNIAKNDAVKATDDIVEKESVKEVKDNG